MLKAAVVLGLLSAATTVSAETCSGFETRLSDLATQVQAMIDIVEAMQPPSGPTCGGIVGGWVYRAQWMAAIWTDGRAPDNSAYAFDPDWCCAQCQQTSGCMFWSLQFRDKLRCQLYGPLAIGAGNPPRTAQEPPGIMFTQALGVGEGGNRISGRIPDGNWGTPAPPSAGMGSDGKDDYMIDISGGVGDKVRVWRGYVDPPMAPLAGNVAEGFETCNTIGPFKPNFNAGNNADNGWSITYYARDPMECCTMCVRNVGIHGAAHSETNFGTASNWVGQDCAVWAYNYDHRKRHCRVRTNTYLFDGTNAWTTIDVNTAAGLYDFQMASECAPQDTSGAARMYPDGTTPCIGGFTSTQWSTGVPWASNLADVPILT